VAPYPLASKENAAEEAERVMESIVEIVRSIRNVRAQYKVKASKWVEARVYADELLSGIAAEASMIEALAKARPLTVLGRQERGPGDDKALVLVLKEAEVVVPLAGMIDRLAEEQRLTKESEEILAVIARIEARLRDDVFLARAPAEVIDKEREKLATLEDKVRRLRQELCQVRSLPGDS